METLDLSPATLGRIYIAGPMTGMPEYNVPAFKAATDLLRKHNYRVISPHEHLGVQDDTELEYARILAYDIMLIAGCRSIVLLDGWNDSKGAKLECYYCESTNKQIVYYKDLKEFCENTYSNA